MTDETDEASRAAQEAARWSARLNGPSIDAATLDAFYQWRLQPDNAHAYDQVDTLWRATAALGADRDIAAAVGSALAPRSPRARIKAALRRHRVAVGALAAAVILVIAWVGLVGHDLRLETAVGEQRLVRLDDGSRLRLNTDTLVQVRFGGSDRRIDLVRGEAFFEVAHDRTRPFTVRADDAQVQALGTRFDVRRTTNGVRVLLAEGSVRVRERNAAGLRQLVLRPGEGVWVSDGRSAAVTPVDIAAATSWTDGHLTFHDTPLRDAVAEINRYAARKIELEAGEMSDARVNGVFETGDLAAFVAAVTVAFPLRAVSDDTGRIRLVRPARLAS